MPTLNRTASVTRTHNLMRKTALAIGGAALIAASAQIEVARHPVPMTLQTLPVLAVGLALGLRLGFASLMTYMAAGLVGLPVFAGGAAGPAVFVGPSGGYLLGFVIAAAFCGWARDRGWTRNPEAAAAVSILGGALVYPTGLLQLGTVIGWDQPVLAWGLYPFILGDLIKALLAGLGYAAVTYSFRR